MALVNMNYYENKYLGSAIEDDDDFARYLRKSTILFNRFTFGSVVENDGEYGMIVRRSFLPFTDEEMDAIKYGICAMCDVLYNIDKAEKTALAGNADSANVKSRSSGGESISYDSAKTVYSNAIGDTKARNELLRSALMENMDITVFRYNPFYAGGC